MTNNNRKLCSYEQIFEISNRRAATCNVVTICCIEGYIEPEIIRCSLDIIQQRHPRLNSLIIGDLDQLQFITEGTQKIPLRFVTREQNQQWAEVVLTELNEKIDSSLGLIRAVFICPDENNVSYLITTIHHAIIDGMSTIKLHSAILTCCQKLMEGELITTVDSLPALPPIDELLPDSLKGIKGKFKNVFFLYKITFQTIWNQPKTIPFEKLVPFELRRSSFVSRQLDKTLTQQLVILCRENNTTVQGTLLAALMLAVFPIMPVAKKTDSIRLSCQSFIDLRRRLKPAISDEHLGVLVSNFVSFHDIQKSTSIWKLAQDVTQQLKKGLESEGMLLLVSLVKKIFTYSVLQKPDKSYPTVGMTNVGRVNISADYGSFRLEEISFVPAVAMFAGCFCVAVVCFQDKMFLNFTFSEPSISQETANIIADNVLSCLVNACNNESM